MSSKLKATQWDERLSFIRGFQGLRTTVFLQSIKGHTGKITALAFSPDGETLASKSKDETICFWDVATGVLKETVECHCDGASAIAFSPDNKALMLATFGNPTLGRDAETGGKEAAKSDGYWITHFTLSSNCGIPETKRGDSAVQLTGLSEMEEFQKDSDGITAFAFSSDRETLASGLRNGSILIWDATTGMYRRTIKSFFGKPETIAFSPDSRRIASGFTSRIWLFDATTGKYLMAIDETTRDAGAIAFCQDNKRLVVGMMDNSIRVYDTATSTSTRTLMSGGDSAIAISPDNKILASASDDYTIRLWDATMGMQEEHMQEEDPRNYPRDAICEAAISPDGKILASTKVHPNDIVQLWDLATRTCQELDPGRSLEVTALAFSPDSKTLASGSDLEIRLWDVVTGTCRQTLTNFKYTQILVIGFSPDGKKLAVGLRFGIMMLLDVMTGKRLWEGEISRRRRMVRSDELLYFHTPRGARPSLQRYSSVAFSPDGTRLASIHYAQSSEDKIGEINFWHTATGQFWQGFDINLPNNEMFTSFMFSSDGKSLYLNHKYVVSVSQPDAETSKPDKETSESGAEMQEAPKTQKLLLIDEWIMQEAPKKQELLLLDGWIMQEGKRLLWVPKEYMTLGQSVTKENIEIF
ncbi:hypothetical protein TrVFT333_011306 [Trichoderma virens FT-333]|nr:hypothetical protein TrVFT333_011306 [Trichoderma virens FT-333]